MPLSPEQQQELQELEDLDKLEGQFGNKIQPQTQQSLAQQALDPQMQDPQMEEMRKNTLGGVAGMTVGSAATAPLAKMLGKPFGAAGDYLMQRAVGMKKFIPGMGKSLANEGLMGTRDMLAGQVEKKMAERGATISNLSKGLQDVPSDMASQRVLSKAQKLVQSDGYIHPADQAEYDYLVKLADDIAARGGPEGAVSGQIAAESRATAGARARKAGAYRDNPSEALKAQAASSEQSGWSQALKDKYAQMNPNQPNLLSEADQAYSTLAKANKPLSSDLSMSQTPWNTKFMSIPGSSLGSSVGGRGLIGLEKMLRGSNPVYGRTLMKYPEDQE